MATVESSSIYLMSLTRCRHWNPVNCDASINQLVAAFTYLCTGFVSIVLRYFAAIGTPEQKP
eukprot:3296760-Amphidinium_carterae.1